jgi:hypothetical protein
MAKVKLRVDELDLDRLEVGGMGCINYEEI